MSAQNISTDEKNRLIFQYQSTRARFRGIFLRMAIVAAAAIGAYVALGEAAARGLADPLLIDFGKLAAIILGGLTAARSLIAFMRMIIRPNEEIRFYVKGFVWVRGGKESFKYPYPEVARYREGGRGIYVGMTPILQWGAHEIEVEDGHIFRVLPRHGSLKRFADRLRNPIAYVTAAKIAGDLRAGKPVKLHPKLTVFPGGVEAGKTKIRWGDMAVLIQRSRLTIRKLDMERGRFRTARRYWIPTVDNVGGFYDLAQGTIRNHRERRPSTTQPTPGAQQAQSR